MSQTTPCLSQEPSAKRSSLGVVIRFKNSAATLPAVLAALRQQTVAPDFILGVDTQSSDGSADLLRRAGARLISWTQPYSHPRVLNFALEHCPADLVLVLSSHTTLQSPDALEKLLHAMADPRTACASGKWDDDPFYSLAIDWQELQRKGLKLGSIYSNSMGILRRSLWQAVRFDESLPTMEDYAWAVEQVRRGHLCRRVDLGFTYARTGQDRDFIFALLAFKIAAGHSLRVAWLGRTATVRLLASLLLRRGWQSDGRKELRRHCQRLWASLIWRWCRWPASE